VNQHYFSTAPSGDFTPREIEVELAGATRRLVTAGGVFSPEHLDEGTRLLLAVCDARDTADVDTADVDEDRAAPQSILDIGCGWGPIALAAALRHPDATVWAVDVNERARELTAMNAARLGLTNVRVAAPDEVPADITFDAIRSNPPIRVGKQMLHDILERWLPRLTAKGSAQLVVAKHLGADSLQRWLSETFAELTVARIARDKGFHVLEAVRSA